ncbi:MAG: GH92 family glycosyl hydrolase [Tannerellaceae bacterium]|nr:GH92 family glycosyl hydrolase [Tannerellaceae bacterium]
MNINFVKTGWSLLLTAALVTGCQTNGIGNMSEDLSKEPVDFVNPFMGNISHLLVPTYPTVHLPNSMLRVYPERGDFTGDRLQGLPVIVTSHRGSSAFNLSPYQGDEANIKPVISYSYDLEKIVPYRYSVYLDEANINVDYAPSYQSAVYSINFEKKAPNYLILNTRNGELTSEGNSISGYQFVDDKTKIYLYAETNLFPEKSGVLAGDSLSFGKTQAAGRNAALVLAYGDKEQTIGLRYGISFISTEQAKKNLQREINAYDVDVVAKAGRTEWNKSLGKIKVFGGTDDERTIFYTSLYRTYERMICISEDGNYYSATDGKIHSDEGMPFYTDDWIWDTYRAVHPLRVLIEPQKELAMVSSYVRMAQQSPEGWMPTFPEVTGDSHRMNGNHAVAVIWDAYCKGLTGFDLDKAYNACKSAIMDETLAPWVRAKAGDLDAFYKEKGYFPALHPNEKETSKLVHPFENRQVIAVTLGASFDDWCLSQIAKALGKTDDYNYFLKRSYNYRNVFNKETAFFHPKDNKGKFIMPFDYVFSGGQGARAYYGENNAWVYRWDVQHNVGDLVTLMGGKDSFATNLDQMFNEPLGKSKFEFYRVLPDHTGNVGQFSMANEPSLHIPYLYNYAGQPWKTQKRIRKLLQEWFRNDLMGVPGDEDGGGMSAFVAFSQMGFYPVTPGSPTYNIGSPVFSDVIIDLGNGKTFEIKAVNSSEDNKYIQSAKLNGKEWNQPWFSHKDIVNGGVLELEMGNKANKEWGAKLPPPSAEKIN